jgi:hypothetical protein
MRKPNKKWNSLNYNMRVKPDQDREVSLYRAANKSIEASSDLARILHELLTATTNLGILLSEL